MMEDLKDAINLNFRFNIGQAVKPKLVNYPAEKEIRYSSIKKLVYVISERIIQQCHGGIQLHYKCRGVEINTGLADENPKFHFSEGEVELVTEQ